MSDAQSRDDERAARLAAQRKAWNDAHPTYYADYRDRNREEIRRKNREYMRDQAQRERDEKERRQKGIARAKAWRASSYLRSSDNTSPMPFQATGCSGSVVST